MSRKEKSSQDHSSRFYDEVRGAWVTVLPPVNPRRRLGIDNVRRVGTPRIDSITEPLYPPKQNKP